MLRLLLTSYFNPRPPRGERHISLHTFTDSSRISIHALREEGDGTVPAGRCRTEAISIHALREEGDIAKDDKDRRTLISIHALREEGDGHLVSCLTRTQVFQSTPSARRATNHDAVAAQIFRFQSTPSARRATHSFQILTYARIDFNPRPPRGGRPVPHRGCGVLLSISIHALREEGD